MADKQRTAFVTARKGFCYLTVKIGRQNFHLMRIRNYALDAQDKRDMRRLYPDTAFDWKKIGKQLAEKRQACRHYRSRRRTSGTARLPRAREPLYAVYDPITRTIYGSSALSMIQSCHPGQRPVFLQGIHVRSDPEGGCLHRECGRTQIALKITHQK